MSQLVLDTTDIRSLSNTDYNEPALVVANTRETFTAAYGPVTLSGQTIVDTDGTKTVYIGTQQLGVPPGLTGWAWAKFYVHNSSTAPLQFTYVQSATWPFASSRLIALYVAPGCKLHVVAPIDLAVDGQLLAFDSPSTMPGAAPCTFDFVGMVGAQQS